MRRFAALTAIAMLVSSGCGKSPKEQAADDARKTEEAKVAADNERQERLLQTVRSRFKDRESAKFMHLHITKYGDGYALCGYVNAKNGYGGYVGYRLFVTSDTPLKLNKERVMVADEGVIGYYGTYGGVSEVGCGAWIIEHGGQNPV